MIDYEALTQEALRSVVRTVITRVAKSGLPGEHHFYVSFHTQAPGVTLSKRLREKYPHEMTIVLQHRFWDLVVADDRFDVKLTFDGIPERLVVPFAAIKVFFDPSVRYGLQFEDGGEGLEPGAATNPLAEGADEGVQEPHTARSRKPLVMRKRRAEKEPFSPSPKSALSTFEPALATRPTAVSHPLPASALPAEKSRALPQAPLSEPPPQRDTPLESVPAPPPPLGSAEIVRLDAFRKK